MRPPLDSGESSGTTRARASSPIRVPESRLPSARSITAGRVALLKAGLLDGLDLPKPYAARIASLRRIMDLVDFEISVFAGLVRGQLARDPGFAAVQMIPGIGPILGAVMVAEIGDITRFSSA